jgi:hypothetical protein
MKTILKSLLSKFAVWAMTVPLAAECASFKDALSTVASGEASVVQAMLVSNRIGYSITYELETAQSTGESFSNLVQTALAHGLVDLSLRPTLLGRGLSTLMLKRGDEDLVFRNGKVRMPGDLYEFLRTVLPIKPQVSSNRLAIVIHEPHEQIQGEYQMIQGLADLHAANKDIRFAYLVEGEYENTDRSIPVEFVSELMTNAQTRNSQILMLLQEYEIDGAFAYRLMQQPRLNGFAIDSNELLQKDRDILHVSALSSNLASLATSLSNASESRRVSQLFYSSESLIDSSQNVAEFESLQQEIRSLASAIADKHPDAMLAPLTNLVARLESYRLALLRDPVMSSNIVAFMEKNPTVVPIIFAGSFHTEGILARLPRDVSTLVLEPREILPKDVSAHAKFQQQLHRRNIHKLPVAPFSSELRSVKTKIETANDEIIRWQNEVRESSKLDTKVTEKLVEVMSRVGPLLHARVEFGDAGGVPPNGPNRPFVRFVPGESGDPPHLIIFDPNPKNWDSARFTLLERSCCVIPNLRSGKRVKIYAQSKTYGLAVYDVNRKFDLFDGVAQFDAYHLLDSFKDIEDAANVRIEQRVDVNQSLGVRL